MSDTAWMTLIVGGLNLAAIITNRLFAWLSERDSTKRAEEVKATLEEHTVITTNKLNTIQKQTNGLVKALVDDTAAASFNAGGDDERANPAQPK